MSRWRSEPHRPEHPDEENLRMARLIERDADEAEQRDLLLDRRDRDTPMIFPAHGRRGTHCRRGHELTPENVYIRPGTSDRACRTCKAARAERYARPSSEYNAWQGMHRRCDNPAHHDYPLYGGRGITVCERWRGPLGFENFMADMGEKPSPDLSLDRIDNDGNYEPGNCRWATAAEQQRNSRNAKLTARDVADIRARRAAGESRQSIAADYPVSAKHITKITTGRKWAA